MKSLSRHDAMKPLSRHHHHALALALKISRTLKDDMDEGALHMLREELQQFWVTGGQEHFREEEEILLPAYARYASPRHEEIIEMLIEHAQIRALVAAIDDGEGDLIATIRELGLMLEKHVRREERVIFPMMEAALPDEVLQKLAPYFHEFHENTHSES